MKRNQTITKAEQYRAIAEVIERLQALIDFLESNKFSPDSETGEMSDWEIETNNRIEYEISLYQDMIDRL